MKDHRKTKDEAHWDKVAGAARASRTGDEDVSAPLGFATRVVSRWAEQRRQQALMLWQRWSRHGAVCSVLILMAAVAYGFAQSRRAVAADDMLFSVPSVNVPLPSDLESL